MKKKPAVVEIDVRKPSEEELKVIQKLKKLDKKRQSLAKRLMKCGPERED